MNWAAVAQKIYGHLYTNAIRQHGTAHNKGAINHRANSISKNGLKAKTTSGAIDDEARHKAWNDAWKEYATHGDIAAVIYQKLNSKEKAERRLTRLQIVAEALSSHWPKVFGAGCLTIQDAKKDYPNRWEIHSAIKDYYTRTLKDTKSTHIAQKLPKNMDALRAAIDQKSSNRDINALIRLGKIIHYTAGEKAGTLDSAQHLLTHFPDANAISNSAFWSSEGQAQIKRNEAFVRVWRRILVLAARTLKDWADPEDKYPGDILDNNIQTNIMDDTAWQNFYDQKFIGVLGKYASNLFHTDPSAKGDILRKSMQICTYLRNRSFHFKGLKDFSDAVQKMANAGGSLTTTRATPFSNFYDAEQKAQAENLIETMRASHFGDFFEQTEIEKMASGIAAAQDVPLPLPKFGKVLLRAKDAWNDEIFKNLSDGLKKQASILPPPHNRAEMEGDNNPLLCQYIGLKMVYDGPFRAWLYGCSSEQLKIWLDLSIERTNAVALDFEIKRQEEYKKATKGNLTKDQKEALYKRFQEKGKDLIFARAAGKIEIKTDTKIIDIFAKLSELTASEMLVQRGYNSNGENAKEQASYLEDVKCDLVLKAFEAFMADRLTPQPYKKLLQKTWPVVKRALPWERIKTALVSNSKSAQSWQHLFFFLLHLVPVDAVNDLYHQIRKWDVLSGKAGQCQGPDAGEILTVMKLYLDRHDAKFTGGMQVGLSKSEKEQLDQFFDAPNTMQKIFPQDKPDVHVPIRGLREFLRFGHFNALMPILSQHKITQADYKQYAAAKDSVVAEQKRREDLHKDLVRLSKKEQRNQAKKYQDYATALKTVMDHRHLAAHIGLVNHVRLHHLAMAVLGRLIDYAGLWERDLYFVALALISETKDEQAKNHNIEIIKNYQGAKTIGKLPSSLQERLKDYFQLKNEWNTEGLDRDQLDPVKIRNDLAHMNMLQKNQGDLDLTQWVNKTRVLMRYDRKLKNAVTKSVIELLAREGILLDWEICTHGTGPHHVIKPIIAPKQAAHFKKGASSKPKEFEHKTRKKILKKGEQIPEKFKILEDLHGRHYQNMAAGLFGGTVQRGEESALDMIAQIDWNPKMPKK